MYLLTYLCWVCIISLGHRLGWNTCHHLTSSYYNNYTNFYYNLWIYIPYIYCNSIKNIIGQFIFASNLKVQYLNNLQKWPNFMYFRKIHTLWPYLKSHESRRKLYSILHNAKKPLCTVDPNLLQPRLLTLIFSTLCFTNRPAWLDFLGIERRICSVHVTSSLQST